MTGMLSVCLLDSNNYHIFDWEYFDNWNKQCPSAPGVEQYALNSHPSVVVSQPQAWGWEGQGAALLYLLTETGVLLCQEAGFLTGVPCWWHTKRQKSVNPILECFLGLDGLHPAWICFRILIGVVSVSLALVGYCVDTGPHPYFRHPWAWWLFERS